MDKLGRYEIEGVIGKGAMAVVYKALDPVIGRAVAIKAVRKQAIDPKLVEEVMTRFRNEARAAGRLMHPNIVGIYEYGDDDEHAFIVMEYVEGKNLSWYLDNKAEFELRHATAIMGQLLHALEFAHERQVVHRDIKPANLMFSAAGRLKVADFGIARIDVSSLTMVGMIIGTPSYMSPEQCQGLEVDGRSDLFSAGVVLYEMLAGQKPFSGSLETVTYKICHEVPPPPSKTSRIRLSPAIDQVVARALAKQPEQRFQTAREFTDALSVAVRAMPAGVAAPAGGAVNEPTVPPAPTVPAANLPPAPTVPAANLPPPIATGRDETVLRTIERELARYVGPVARVMVKRAAEKANDLTQLSAMLAQQIDDPAGRRSFAAATARLQPTSTGLREVGAGAQPTAIVSAPPAPLPQAFVDAVTAKLAIHMGPIAKILAKKAAREATSEEAFVHALASQLSDEQRARFLRAMGM